MGYLPGMWRDFGVTIGSLAGALTGLLFVAVSIKSDTLAKSRSLRSRAAQTLVLFMTSALAAVVLAAPQPGDALGGELIALAALSGAALYVLDRRGGHNQDSRVARYIERASPNAITTLLFGVAGVDRTNAIALGLLWFACTTIGALPGALAFVATPTTK